MAIDFNLLQPVDIGGQFLAGMQAGQEQRLQQQQQAEKMARAQRMQQDIAAWKGDMSPERTADLLMNYPEIKDQILSSQSVLNDASKRDRLDFASRALMLSKAGQKERVVEMAQQRIDAYRNAGKDKEAAEAEAMLKAYEIDPRVGEGALALDVATADPKLYETLFGQAADKTAFQQDFEYIKKTFGDNAAAEFAQFGRTGIVSIPLGNGQTYVGPASMAPGASRWKEQPSETGESAPSPSSGAETILRNASGSKTITKQEADVVRQSLGRNGQAAFNNWLKQNQIRVIVRTGKAPDGRRVVQYQDGTVEYGD